MNYIRSATIALPLTHEARMHPTNEWVVGGGAEGTRTPDFLNAIEALSQLSYSPEPGHTISKANSLEQAIHS